VLMPVSLYPGIIHPCSTLPILTARRQALILSKGSHIIIFEFFDVSSFGMPSIVYNSALVRFAAIGANGDAKNEF
jgi:hypothetical protein